ncbi:MAG TPA: BadF/BadG/BcrA/BcrD ATPase family protein [Candidatus Limnocylindria bacterium]|nr:BadF/BadG/BcrA/BcrD ATPase family protein [Candidatus Limnocylindria bacterium]
MTAAVLAVDGGNSKTDVALVSADGRLLATVRGGTVSHQVIGLAAGAAQLEQLIDAAHARAGLAPASGPPELGVFCVAGADFASDERQLRAEFARRRLAGEVIVFNDTFAALRAGARSGWGVVLICGQGVNGAALAANGRTHRFAGIGPLSGDWGGGGALGEAALGAAIRARDGRGSRTSLERAVAGHFGLRTPERVMIAVYEGRMSRRRLSELAPVVFAQAEAGDAVARAIVDRLADELALMAVALIRRLRATRREVEVVLAGGVFTATDPVFYARLTEGVQRVAAAARLVKLDVPPVAGAALLGLDRLSPTGSADLRQAERLRAAFAARRGDR